MKFCISVHIPALNIFKNVFISKKLISYIYNVKTVIKRIIYLQFYHLTVYKNTYEIKSQNYKQIVNYPGKSSKTVANNKQNEKK